MPKKIILLTSSKKTAKKYDITGPSLKNSISFGAKGYSDYTIHKDPKRKDNYIKRHQVNEDWNDINKAGTWSKYLLWNKPTLQESIKNMENKFDIKIKRKLKI
jgi:hypothetical protein